MRLNSSDNRKLIGQIGEQHAVDYLVNKKYHITERNWRCRSGEIDIVATFEEMLIFIEVRTRKNKSHFGIAAESVNRRKQKKLREITQVYLHLNGKNNTTIRFDVITVLLNSNDSTEKIEHICNAF